MGKMNPVLFAALIGTLLLTLAACSDDNSTEPQVTVEPPPPTGDILMDEFITALEEEDIARLDWLVNEDFHMNILPATINDWAGGDHPLLVDYFDHDDFLEIHGNIFADSTGLDPGGNPVPSITGISVDLMDKVTNWEPIDPEMEYFGDIEGTTSSRWNVLTHFNLEGNSRFELNQQMVLLTRPVMVGEDSGWELVGIVPIGHYAGNKTAETWWDAILALYR